MILLIFCFFYLLYFLLLSLPADCMCSLSCFLISCYEDAICAAAAALKLRFSIQTGTCSSAGRLPGTQLDSEVCLWQAQVRFGWQRLQVHPLLRLLLGAPLPIIHHPFDVFHQTLLCMKVFRHRCMYVNSASTIFHHVGCTLIITWVVGCVYLWP